MAYTKGPWYWVKYPKTKTIRLMGEKQLIVMDFSRWGMQSAQPRFIQTLPSGIELMVNAECVDLDADSNARLISAAPSLLEALKTLLHACEIADEIGELYGSIDGEMLDAARAAITMAEDEQQE